MQEVHATAKADELIKIILQNHPSLFSTNFLVSEENSRKAAQGLAAFRAELIAQLKPQS